MIAKREKLILGAGTVIFFTIISLISVFKYFRFGFNGFDLAIYNQAFWNTIHGRLFATSINPPSYLGDHAEWLILALAPVYALVPHPLTLVFLKIAAVAISAIPIWMIAKLKFNDAKTRLLFPLLWLVNPYVWNMALFEFHLITFAAPLTLFAAYFFLKNRWNAFIVTIILLLLCREDMAFIVIGFALLATYTIIRHRRARNDVIKWIIIPAVLAIIIFAIDQRVIAHFNPDGAYKFFIYYEWLGRTPLAIIGAALSHPLGFLLHFVKLTNLYLVVVLMLPILFLPFVRPRFLLLIILVAAEYMLTKDGAEMVIIKTQYAAAFMPAIMLATIEGYERLIRGQTPYPNEKGSVPILFKFIPKAIMPAIVVVASVYVWFAYGPGVGLTNGFAPPNARSQAMQAAVALVPKDAPVVASIGTLTQLSSRQNVWPMSYFWIGKKQFGVSDYILPVKPEYLILDERDFVYFAVVYPNYPWAAASYSTAPDRLRSFIADGKYGVIFNRDGIAVLKRGVGGPLPFIAIHETKPMIVNAINEKIGPLNFLGSTPAASNDTGPHLFFSTDRPITKDLVIKINNEYYPLGNGLYPATAWKPNEVVEIIPPIINGKMTIQLVTVSGGLTVAPDGSLLLTLPSAHAESDKVVLP